VGTDAVEAGTMSPPVLLSDSGLPLLALRSPSITEWTAEDMMLDWSEPQTVDHLHRLRDFFVEGMTVNVVEEKVQLPYNHYFSLHYTLNTEFILHLRLDSRMDE